MTHLLLAILSPKIILVSSPSLSPTARKWPDCKCKAGLAHHASKSDICESCAVPSSSKLLAGLVRNL